MNKISAKTRRRFLQETATLAAGMSLSWPRVSQAATRHVASDDKLAIGIIGAGGAAGTICRRCNRSGS